MSSDYRRSKSPSPQPSPRVPGEGVIAVSARGKEQIKAHPLHVAIFANPIAGRGKGKRVGRLLAKKLESRGIHATVCLDLAASADDDLIANTDAAIVIGGDGTLRGVAKRYYLQRGTCPPLLPVPMGTANLMGRHLGISWNSTDLERRVVESIERGKLSYLDAAQANGDLFLLMAGIGIDGFIVHELDRLRDGPIHYASYLLPAALAWTTYEYTPLTVRVDGKPVFNQKPGMAFVGNVSEYGTGFPLLPDAKPDDGLLDVCVIPARSRLHVVEQFLRAAAGEHLLAEGVVHTRGKKIEITAPQPVPMQIDGDPAAIRRW
jgi:diacylglycerol kinase (ATP)